MLGITRKKAFILNFIFNPDWELYANDTNLWGLRYKCWEIFPHFNYQLSNINYQLLTIKKKKAYEN